MTLTYEQVRIVLLLVDWIKHLPESIQAEATAEIEEAWELHDFIYSNRNEPK